MTSFRRAWLLAACTATASGSGEQRQRSRLAVLSPEGAAVVVPKESPLMRSAGHSVTNAVAARAEVDSDDDDGEDSDDDDDHHHEDDSNDQTKADLGSLVVKSMGEPGGDPGEPGGYPGKKSYYTKKKKKAGSVIFLGTTTLIIVIFYLAHCTDEDIKGMTWKIMSDTIAIYVAVLVLGAKGDLENAAFSEADIDRFIWLRFLGGLIRTTLIFFIAQLLLYRCRLDKYRLASSGLAGAHLVSFSSINTFGALQDAAYFRSSPICASLVVPLGIVYFLLVVIMNVTFRKFLARRDGVVDEHELEWKHECEHAETEFIGTALGYLLAQVCMFSVIGTMPMYPAVAKSRTPAEMQALGIVSAVLIGLLLVWTTVMSLLGSKSHTFARFVETVTETICLTFGWVNINWLMWCFWWYTGTEGLISEGDLAMAQMVMAVFFSSGCFLIIIILDKIADRAGTKSHHIRMLEKAFVLIIALSWEKTAMKASGVLSVPGENSNGMSAWLRPIRTIVLALIPVPMWVWYIMPKAYAFKHKKDELDIENLPEDDVARLESWAMSCQVSEVHRRERLDEFVGAMDRTESVGSSDRPGAASPAPALPLPRNTPLRPSQRAAASPRGSAAARASAAPPRRASAARPGGGDEEPAEDEEGY